MRKLSKKKRSIALDAVDYIRGYNGDAPLTADVVADALDCSLDSLNKEFRRYYDVGVSVYLESSQNGFHKQKGNAVKRRTGLNSNDGQFRVIEILDFIRKNYWKKECQPKHIASVYNLSLRHMSYIFKKHSDLSAISPVEYIAQLRLQLAFALCQSGLNFSIRQLASETGFSSSASIHRLIEKSGFRLSDILDVYPGSHRWIDDELVDEIRDSLVAAAPGANLVYLDDNEVIIADTVISFE